MKLLVNHLVRNLPLLFSNLEPTKHQVLELMMENIEHKDQKIRRGVLVQVKEMITRELQEEPKTFLLLIPTIQTTRQLLIKVLTGCLGLLKEAV